MRPRSLVSVPLLIAAAAVPATGAGQGVDISSLGYNQGSAQAPLRVVEFGDFGCSHCRDFHAEVFPVLKAEYIDTGRIAWKYIPVAFTTFPRSEIAAIASECAADQGLFFPMRDALYELQSDWQTAVSPSGALTQVADSAGLNLNRFGECLAAQRGKQTIDQNTRIAAQSGVRTTPTFVILGREMMSLPGSLPIDLFRDVLDEALAGLGGEHPDAGPVRLASLTAPQAGPRSCTQTAGQRVLEAMNRIRTDAGLQPLAVDVRLIESARGHTADMVRESFFSHDGSDGSDVGSRALRAGFEWSVIGENIFAGYDDPSKVVAGWMDSPPHREMILTPTVTHVGIAYLDRPYSRLKHYWTANFGAPLKTPRSTPDGCHP